MKNYKIDSSFVGPVVGRPGLTKLAIKPIMI